MLLIDFKLDYPVVFNEQEIQELQKQNDWDENEASAYWYEKNWKNKRIQVIDESRCIASLYREEFLNIIKKFQTENCRCISINIYDDKKESEIKNFDGICEVSICYPMSNYFKSSNYEKKKILLDLLYKGVELYVKTNKLDLNPFRKAYEKVIEKNYVNHYYVKKPLKSPNRELSAQLFSEHEIDKYYIYVVFKDKQNKILKKELIKTERPNEYLFMQHLGTMKWINNSTVEVWNRYKELIKRLDI